VNKNHCLIEYDDALDRTKITIFFARKWGYLTLFSSVLIIWLAMLTGILAYLVGGYSPSIVLTFFLLIWLAIWLVFGRFLWKRWQYSAAGREILFIDQEQLIIRRPVSILGITDAYDMAHISPFYYSDTHNCPAFDYAYLHVYFGHQLSHEDAMQIINEVNPRWFPEPDVALEI
jgi:hypothetical protein